MSFGLVFFLKILPEFPFVLSFYLDGGLLTFLYSTTHVRECPTRFKVLLFFRNSYPVLICHISSSFFASPKDHCRNWSPVRTDQFYPDGDNWASLFNCQFCVMFLLQGSGPLARLSCNCALCPHKLYKAIDHLLQDHTAWAVSHHLIIQSWGYLNLFRVSS